MWIINILEFLYNAFFFYFVPISIVFFVQEYGMRPIKDDTEVIEVETANTSLTLTQIKLPDFGIYTNFVTYYQSVNNMSS
jgi:hypothetical protein